MSAAEMNASAESAANAANAKSTVLTMDLGERSYDIIVERGALARAGELLNLDRKVLVLTDDGVPAQYAAAVADQCAQPLVFTVPQGEESKGLSSFGEILEAMIIAGFTRKDAVVAVGGGVVGDLAGFVAASYMRGVDFYNIPTTVLSQVDSSIGGKTAINLGGYKNMVGAFWQPKRVIIDCDVLATLDPRQLSNGLAEAVKMALTSDPELFALFEAGDVDANLDEIIVRSLRVKKDVVEQDERETGLRRILNFGHTLGHGIEVGGYGLYHGECVALGMIGMCAPAVRERLVPVLAKLGLPTTVAADADAVLAAVAHDKKGAAGKVAVVTVPEVGRWEIATVEPAELRDALMMVL